MMGKGGPVSAGHFNPEIVCLCGSTRFYDEFQQANYDLTMKGLIVLSVGFYPHAKHGHGEGVGHDSAEKLALDNLHKRKIDLADWVYVLNVGGYIGESTRSEIEYAEKIDRPVRYLEPVLDRATMVGGLPGHDEFRCASSAGTLPVEYQPPNEPPVGTVIGYVVQLEQRDYHYASLRAGDGRWYTTGSSTQQGVSWAALVRALRAKQARVSINTGWREWSL